MEVTRPLGTIKGTLGCASLRWSTDDKVKHILTQGTGALKKVHLRVKKWFAMERLQTLQSFVNVVSTKYDIEQFTEIFCGH